MAATLLNHLWQSTLFALAASALTISLRQYTARTRYLIWFAVSLKFLIPFSVLTAVGLQLRPSSSIGIEILPKPLLSATLKVAEPISVNALFGPDWGSVIAMIWALGVAIVLARWLVSWLRARSVVRAAQPYPMDLDIEVRVSTELSEPGVFGIRQPTLLLPPAVIARLSKAELDAVIAHELCHVRNRDNLTAAVHMLAEALFWYHPIVWWVGRQMLKERERACDEAVIELGAAPGIYAAGILKACRLSLESRLGVVAAAGGSNLKERVEAIIHWRPARKLSSAGKAGLVTIPLASVILPLLTGFATPPPNSASSSSHRAYSLRFDSVSIQQTPVASHDKPRLTLTETHLSMKNTSLRKLISVASRVSERQVLGGPLWLDQRYDIEADTASAINRRMILALLTDKFGLQFVERNLEGSDKDPL
jgi:bla regulator protein blaR1